MRKLGFCWIANTTVIGLDVRATEKAVLSILPVFFLYMPKRI
jgi:hypothetical protein